MVAAQCGLTGTGCVIIGTITALGGGCVRDLIFNKPFFVLEETEYLYIAVIFASAAFILAWLSEYPFGKEWNQVLWLLDTIGLGAFSVIATMYGVRLQMGVLPTLVCTIITCTGGGIIRDIICRRPPRVMHNFQEVYAETTLGGGVVYLLLRAAGLPLGLRVIGGGGTTCLLRCLATQYDIRLPHAPSRRVAEIKASASVSEQLHAPSKLQSTKA